MKFKKSKEWDGKTLVFKDKDGDVLTINRYMGEGIDDDLFVHVHGSVRLKRRKAIRLALAILDELEPGHSWA